MDFKVNTIEELLKTNICRCCLKSENIMQTECFISERKTIYEDMLKNTFDIQFSQPHIDGYLPHICEDCTMKIQEAYLFKQTVLDNEIKFNAMVDQLYQVAREATDQKSHKDIKIDEIKTELSPVMDYCEDSFDDDEILANIKLELTQNNIMTSNYTNRRMNINKCKINPSSGNQKDWSKIAERRGSGPMLRENSLKILANSTIFVFQWNKSRYRCFCCMEPFSDVNLLRDHTNTNHNLKSIEKKIINQQNRLVKVEISILKCQICRQNLLTIDSLIEHLIDIHKVEFESRENLLVPFKINDDLQCQICYEKFSVFRHLNIHMNKHFQKQVCHICGAGFSNLVFLNLHKTRSHRPLKCRHCDMNFNNKTDKKKHEIEVHNVKFERKLRFPCPYCNERFYQENFRVQHLVEKHGLKKPEFKCQICSKIFITKSLCNNHLKNVHLKEKCHECDVCHSFFYTKSDVIRHKVTHTGEKNYACSVCSNPFASKDSLRRHMRRTHGVN